tara:strand:- start:329 stop:607 length:279 start_codon:yes stop_codon:yes gene_type:complete
MINKKKKIEVDGKKIKVEDSVYNLLAGMNQTIYNHEIMILTWVHKHYTNHPDDSKKSEYEKNLFNYAMQLPNATETLKMMLEYDEKEKENQE